MNRENISPCATETTASCGGRKRKLFLATWLICMLMVTMSLYYTGTVRLIRPATVPLDEPVSHMDETGRQLKLKALAMNLTSNIERLSNLSSCENRSTLYCGNHNAGCGLGCQLHHEAACLMLSYSMKIPLIHDTTAWPYGKWEDTFLPLGSSCPVNERTLIVRWAHKGGHAPFLNNFTQQDFPYDFGSGIPVDQNFLRAINESHPTPFQWYVGQFMKYTMRLSSKIGPVVNDFLSELPHSSPMVGLHIRRTDKVIGKIGKRPYHEMGEYMIPAEAYFRRVNLNLNRTVYLASDDHKLLSQAKELYPLPKWRFIGSNMTKTFPNQKARLNNQALLSIIKDVLALNKCHYVICDFSSNICRILAELNSADHLDGFERVKSLDRPYVYKLKGTEIPNRLIPIAIEKHE